MFRPSTFFNFALTNITKYFNLTIDFAVFFHSGVYFFLMCFTVFFALLMFLFLILLVVFPFLFQAPYTIFIYSVEFFNWFSCITSFAILLLHNLLR